MLQMGHTLAAPNLDSHELVSQLPKPSTLPAGVSSSILRDQAFPPQPSAVALICRTLPIAKDILLVVCSMGSATWQCVSAHCPPSGYFTLLMVVLNSKMLPLLS